MVSLNDRFRHGHPSSNLREAGVLIHMWDRTEDAHQPWRGCPHRKPPPGSSPDLAGSDCMEVGDRFSSSIVWKGRHRLFGAGGGIIFHPDYTRILCSFGADGGTRSGSDKCDGSAWCDVKSPSSGDGWCSGRAFRPEDLEHMLRGWDAKGEGSSYNEVLVDMAHHDLHLPHSVEAIIYDQQVHKHFIEHYSSKGYHITDRDVPLVDFDPNSDRGFKPKFNQLLYGSG